MAGHNLFFSNRLNLAKECEDWCKLNGVEIGTFNTITYLDHIGLLNTEKVEARYGTYKNKIKEMANLTDEEFEIADAMCEFMCPDAEE